MSSGRWIVFPEASSRRQVSTCSGSNSESPIGVALRGEEREAHRTADDQGVDDLEERLDDAELVRDLRSAEHRDERSTWLVAQAEQDVDLLLQQQSHRRRERLRRADDRRVGAVRGAERVVDVGVDPVRQAARRTPASSSPRPDRSGGSRAVRRPARARPAVAAPAPSSTSGRGRPSAGRGATRRRRWRRGRAATRWSGARRGSGSRR